MIKYFAMFTMFLNHFSHVFLNPHSLLHMFFTNLGYFTAITMCYFLVEGYEYTHSKKKYAQRLLLFGFISEIPYLLTFSTEAYIEYYNLNIFFTLFLCFMIILTVDKVTSKPLKVLAVISLILLSTACDWPVFAPVFTLLFIWAKGSAKNLKIAYGIAALSFGLFNFVPSILYQVPLWENILYTLFYISGVLLSGICIIYFYNGKRSERYQIFSKWFFYLFYPVHLLILGIARIIILM